MGIYDKEREALGITGASSVSTPQNTKSIYAAERVNLNGPVQNPVNTKQAQDAYWANKLAPKVDNKKISMFGQPKNPMVTPVGGNAMNAIIAKQTGIKPIDIRDVLNRIPTKSELKSPVVQFTSGAAESTLPRAISALQTISTGKAPLVERMKAESAPYANGFRTAGQIYGETMGNAATYGIFGKAISGASALQKISNPLLRNIVAGQLADTVIQTPVVLAEGVANKQSAGQIAKNIGREQVADLAGNVLFGVGESFIKSIAGKLAAGKVLTQAEVEAVKSTPELRALPEAKQYLMLEATKTKPYLDSRGRAVQGVMPAQPANVIEAMPIKGRSNALKNQFDAAEQSLIHNVPEQYRKETPFTVVKSSVPQKVESKYATERFNATQEPTMPLKGNNTMPINKVAQNGVQAPTLPEPSAKVNLNTKRQRKPLNIITNIIDSQRPIDKLSRKTSGKEYILASNSRNVGGTVDYILKNGLVDRQGNAIGESLQDIANTIPKGKEQAFWDYMMQRGNIDRAREGKPIIPNYTPEMSKKAADMAESANPEFKALGDNVTGWIDKFMRTWGVDAGTVDETIYNDLRKTYKSYVPTQREFSELEKAIPGGVSRKYVDQSSPIKKATGSERNIKNPIENIMGLVNRTVRTARYNEVGQELLKSVREGKTDLAEIIPAKEGMFANTDNIVTVLENGKPTYLRINDKRLLDALEGLPKTVNNLAGLRKVTGIYKGLITQKNPLFAVRNVARDLPTAYVYGSTANPLRFGKDYLGALKDIATNSPKYQQYKAIGGGGSNFFKQGETLAKDLTGKKNVLQKIGGAIETFNNMTETAPRLAEFNRTLERTGDIDKALYAANDVTVNFARGGNWTKSAEPLVPYLNAGVQGLDKLYRSVKDPKTFAKMLIKGGISISTPTIALYMINKDNPYYQELDNRTKDNYFLIPSGEKDEYGNSKTFIKIPKSRELGVMFGALFERVLRSKGGDKEAWKGFGNTVATNFAPTNPLENNFFSPILNLKSNQDFAGRAIVPQSMLMDKRSPKLQYDERTSEIAKWLGDKTNLSPKQIDYLVRSYTGIAGQIGLPATTKGGNPVKVITNQFVADPAYSNQTITDFYDNFDKYTRLASDTNIKSGGNTRDITPQEQIKNMYSKASDKMSELNKISTRIISGTATPDDKKVLSGYGITQTDAETTAKAIKEKMADIAKETNKLNPAQFNRTIPAGTPPSLEKNKVTYDLTYQQQYELADLISKYKKLYSLQKGWTPEQAEKTAKERAYAEMKRKLK
jgi:hypothetical protein